MSNLNEFKTRLKIMLQDPDGLFWMEAELEHALQMALSLYSSAGPLEDSTVLTLPAAGRERADEEWPPNRVRGFRTTLKNGAPVLLLTSKRSGRPQAGDEVRIWYTRRQTIEGFQGAAVTTLTAEGENLVTTGAAGLAAVAALVDHSLPVAWERVGEWASAWIKMFERGLDELASRESRICGEPWGEGWQLDSWDELPTAG